jgi:hypothetical protein
MAQEPEAALPVQLSPVLALTVTVPEGVSVLPGCAATEKATVTGSPTSEGLNVTLVIPAIVLAFTAVP